MGFACRCRDRFLEAIGSYEVAGGRRRASRDGVVSETLARTVGWSFVVRGASSSVDLLRTEPGAELRAEVPGRSRTYVHANASESTFAEC